MNKMTKRMKNKYVISSSEFTSKPKAIKKLKEWLEDNTLDEKAKVYEVSEIWKVKQKIVLVKEK